MDERMRGWLDWWPAVAVPVLVVGVVILVVQQLALSNQLVDLRRDLGGLTTELVLLQQELRDLRRAVDESREVRNRPRRPARGKAKRGARAAP